MRREGSPGCRRCSARWRRTALRPRASTSTSSGRSFRPHCRRTRNTERCRRCGTRPTCGRWGEHEEAVRRIESAWVSNPASAILAREMIRMCAERGEIERAEDVFRTFEAQGLASAVSHVANTLAEVLLEAGDERKAQELLKRIRPMTFGQDAIDAAILARRLRDSHAAHRYFERAGDAVYADPRALLEFAQTKIWLARGGPWSPPVGLESPVAQRSPDALGAGYPARYGAHPPCLGVARACAHAQLAAGAVPRSRGCLSQGDRALARRGAVRSRVGDVTSGSAMSRGRTRPCRAPTDP